MNPSRYCFCSSVNPKSCTDCPSNASYRCCLLGNPHARVAAARTLSADRRAGHIVISFNPVEEPVTITLYDLAGAEAERRFSPFCWRTKMALAHKGLEV